MTRLATVAAALGGLLCIGAVLATPPSDPVEICDSMMPDASRSRDAHRCYLLRASLGDAAAYAGVGETLLRPQVMEAYGMGRDEAVRAAANWFARAADNGVRGAELKMRELGAKATTQRGFPVSSCRDVAIRGSAEAAGVFLGHRNYTDAYSFRVREKDGTVTEVVMGNGDVPEFSKVKKGDRVKLGYTSRQSLDISSALCSRTHYYIPGSGRILR